ncbi:MAG: hypothetical protein OEY87_05050, partial [Gammaproteobacteria bacterium]|nr:hypothetical protein [Gammaproteobacteria bacterium]
NGLEDNRFTLNIGYSFSQFTLGYHRERSLSAVNNATYTTNSINGSFNLTDNWQLGAETGQAKDSTTTDTVSFKSLSITYNW